MRKTDIRQLMDAVAEIIKSIHQHSYSNHENQKLYPGQPKFLCLLKEHEGITQKELARKHFVKPSTVTGMLAKLEANHYVYRIPDPIDKRIQRVYLTPEGRNLAERGEAIMAGLTQKMFDGFSDEELQIYLRLTNKIRDNLR